MSHSVLLDVSGFREGTHVAKVLLRLPKPTSCLFQQEMLEFHERMPYRELSVGQSALCKPSASK